MKSAHRYALPPAVVTTVTSLIGLLVTWLVGALTSHQISLPIVLVPFLSIITGVITYLGHYLIHWLASGDPTPIPPGS